MKKLKLSVALMLMILIGFAGCAKKVSDTSASWNIEDFQEIDCAELSTYLDAISEEIPSSETDWLVNYIGIDTIEFRSEDMNIHYDYYNIVYQIDDTEVSYVNEDGIDTRDIAQAYGYFNYRYGVFEEYCEEYSDEIIMEMQDTRGYIIFDIDDPEIISEISFREDVNENTRYYGCIYFCNGGYLEACYLSDDDEYLDEFVEILDEFNLPHL